MAVQLFVAFGGKTILYDSNRDSTIGHLKQWIEDREMVPLPLQQLQYHGTCLPDDRSLNGLDNAVLRLNVITDMKVLSTKTKGKRKVPNGGESPRTDDEAEDVPGDTPEGAEEETAPTARPTPPPPVHIPKPKAPSPIKSQAYAHTTALTDLIDKGGFTCQMCARPQPRAQWSCVSCSYLNFGDRTRCEMCDGVRPRADVGSISLADWQCGFCTFFNGLNTDAKAYELIQACFLGDLDSVKEILSKDSGLIEAVYSAHPGYNPIMAAAMGGRFDVVQFLLSGGARICVQSAEGYSPLLLAAYFKHEGLVTLLIRETDGNQLLLKTKDGFSIREMLQIEDAVNRGFSRLRVKIAKLKGLLLDLMGPLSSNGLANLIIEYCIAAALNAHNVGEDRRLVEAE